MTFLLKGEFSNTSSLPYPVFITASFMFSVWGTYFALEEQQYILTSVAYFGKINLKECFFLGVLFESIWLFIYIFKFYDTEKEKILRSLLYVVSLTLFQLTCYATSLPYLYYEGIVLITLTILSPVIRLVKVLSTQCP